MTVRINKPAINLREKLAELDKPSGLTGEELLRSQTSEEARNSLDLEEHLFENFESTGIDDNATSTKVTVSDSGVDFTGTVTADGLTVDGDATLGVEGTGSQVTMQMPSLSSSYPTRLIFDGVYDSGTSDVNIKAVGVPSGGPYGADLNFFTSFQTQVIKRASIGSNGDVHLYEDTGTTAKFVWDSSAEGLSIGGTALGKFNVSDGTNPLVVDCNATYNEIQSYNRPLQINRQGNNTILNSTGGNVGIGTASPSGALDIGGQCILNDNYDGIGATFRRNGTHGAVVALGRQGLEDGVTLDYPSTNTLGFSTGGSERARIDSSGNLLVGTTAFPTDDNTTLGFGVKSNGETRASTNGIPTLHLKRATSDGDIVVFRKNLASSVGSISITGSATSYNTSSDERLKENIQDTTHNVDINDIRVREFDWKTDGEHQRFGFIAQELETVYPEAVSTDDSEEQMKSVDYSKLVPLLVKEIQTLKARIETLENN